MSNNDPNGSATDPEKAVAFMAESLIFVASTIVQFGQGIAERRTEVERLRDSEPDPVRRELHAAVAQELRKLEQKLEEVEKAAAEHLETGARELGKNCA